MPAGGRDGRTGHTHAGADCVAITNGITQSKDRFQVAANVLHGGEARFQRPPGMACADKGPVRAGEGEGVKTAIGTTFAEQVNVRVNQAGQHPVPGKIDNFCAVAGNIAVFYGLDTAITDDDRCAFPHPLARHSDQVACVNYRDCGSVFLSLCDGHTCHHPRCQQRARQSRHVSLPAKFLYCTLFRRVRGRLSNG